MVVRAVEHSNSRFESIRFDSLCESILFVKKSAFRFTSCHAVFLVYLLYSLSQKSKLTSLFAAFNTLDVFNLLEIVYLILIWHSMNHSVKRRRQALHPKSTSLLFEYQCISGKFIRLANRIESKLFCPNWNALVESLIAYRSWLIILFGGVTWAQWREQVVRSRYAATPPPCSNPFCHQYIDFYIFWTCALFFFLCTVQLRFDSSL